MILATHTRQYISDFYMLPERDFYFFLIIFLIELVLISLKVTARIAAGVIIIVILRNFTVNGFLHIGGEFLAVYRGAKI